MKPVLAVMGTVRTELLVHEGFNAATSQRSFGLCLTDMGGLVFLPRLIGALREAAPHCTLRALQVAPRQVAAVLESGEANLAMSSLHSVPEGLFQQQLFMRNFGTIVNRNNRAVGTAMSEQQFYEMEHIVVSTSGRREDSYDAVIDQAPSAGR